MTVRDMPMNGTVGRAKTLARIRREGVARAARAGVDTTDRAAVRRFTDAYSSVTLAGIGDRARCRCGGPRHDVITAPMGATP